MHARNVIAFFVWALPPGFCEQCHAPLNPPLKLYECSVLNLCPVDLLALEYNENLERDYQEQTPVT